MNRTGLNGLTTTRFLTVPGQRWLLLSAIFVVTFIVFLPLALAQSGLEEADNRGLATAVNDCHTNAPLFAEQVPVILRTPHSTKQSGYTTTPPTGCCYWPAPVSAVG